MLKLFGRKVKPTYSLQKGLCSVYGIGETTSKDICSDLGLNPSLKISKVTLEEEGEIQHWVQTKGINPSSIKKIRRDFVSDLISTKSYRGMRHKNKYPVRGQRTSTNARTQKRIGGKHAKI